MSLGVNQFSGGGLLSAGNLDRSGDEIRCGGEIFWSHLEIRQVTEVIEFPRSYLAREEPI
jgi:hypothetical protein